MYNITTHSEHFNVKIMVFPAENVLVYVNAAIYTYEKLVRLP